MRNLVKVLSTAAIFLSCTLSVANSQDQTDTTNGRSVVTESFGGSDPALILGGQISFVQDSAPWLVYLSNGNLVMENRQNPKSLQYNDIAWVKFPESGVLTSTENLIISAIVESENVGNGGAGILIGSGKAGAYLAFAVDGQGRYHVLKKESRKLRTLHSAKHTAIVVGAPNRLTFEVRGAHIAFLANGTEVIQVPYVRRLGSSGQSGGRSGIGIAAFGTGKFLFDSVAISRAD